jgi:hypothetical protein
MATFLESRNSSGGILPSSSEENTKSGASQVLMTTMEIRVAVGPRACSRITREAMVSMRNSKVASSGSLTVNLFTISSMS